MINKFLLDHKDFTDIPYEDAKPVINCVWETKGRYGLNIIPGTLPGANKAGLKELGTTEYRTFGALKSRYTHRCGSQEWLGIITPHDLPWG